jgi:8-oxo-dGTP pyrophosphatase MutT (NUDIX family)
MNLNDHKNLFLAEIAAHQPFDALEAEHLRRTLELLKSQPEPFSRSTRIGHITASVILIDETVSSVAMIWHEKLGRWLQPGGHCEPDQDDSVAQAALRELIEETSIPPQHIILLQGTPFDVDVHPIPARGDEPDHFHYDVRYLFQTQHNHLQQGQWRSIEDIAQIDDPSRSRFAQKLLIWRKPVLGG